MYLSIWDLHITQTPPLLFLKRDISYASEVFCQLCYRCFHASDSFWISVYAWNRKGDPKWLNFPYGWVKTAIGVMQRPSAIHTLKWNSVTCRSLSLKMSTTTRNSPKWLPFPNLQTMLMCGYIRSLKTTPTCGKSDWVSKRSKLTYPYNWV